MNRLRGRGAHLFHKGRHHRHVLGAKAPTCRASRTTLLPKSASAAVRRLGLVDVVHHPRPSSLGSPPPQILSRRAAVGVALGRIGESFSTKRRFDPRPWPTPPTRFHRRADEVHLPLRHLHNCLARGVPRVGYHLLDRKSV